MKILLIVAIMALAACSARAGTDKTLVSWAAITDPDVRAGSILTIQLGSQFDGIVFAERSPGRWMAGSDFFRRTNADQQSRPVETADGKALVQMAIVYQDDRITIYRNGKVYEKHKARNIDLLGSDNNFAVFGLRHIGGGGSIAGLVEDARIYAQALTVDQIKSLKPNEESSIKPYAWWDFEGDKAADRTGRFSHSKFLGGAKLEDGKLMLGKNAILIASAKEPVPTPDRPTSAHIGPYEPETPTWPEKLPKEYLNYHLAHPRGTGPGYPGDPNPAFYYKGRYHLHYIYKSDKGGGFAYAHVSSKDMVHWKWHPTVLVPRTTGHGMFSGTGFFTKDGRPAMIYHGQGSGRNQISYALDDNLDKWTRPQAVEPKNEDGSIPQIRHWDPDCWRMGGTYYALSGGKDPELMKSKDLKNWLYLGKLLHEDYPADLGIGRNEDISCANMFKIGDKWMLLCISHRLGCRYYLGDFKDEKYLPEYHERMSHGGRDYFAPESVLTKDGRRVMWAWVFAKAGDLTAIQGLPRELELPEDGVLRIRPLRELESLRYDEKCVENITVENDRTHILKDIAGDSIEIKLTCKAPVAKEIGIDVLCDENGEKGMRIALAPGKKTLSIGKLQAPFELKDGEDLVLRVFVDKTIVEVFANDRQAVFAHRPRYDPALVHVRLFSSGGEAKVRSVKGWKMKSVYEGDSVFRGH